MKACEHLVNGRTRCRMPDGHYGMHNSAPLVSYLAPQASRRDDIPAPVRAALKQRSGGVCELCQQSTGAQAHHRKRRSQGGRHELANLLHLCPRCHLVEVHGTGNSDRAYALGWLVRSGADPADVPVVALERVS